MAAVNAGTCSLAQQLLGHLGQLYRRTHALRRWRLFILVSFLCLWSCPVAWAGTPPELMLAGIYEQGIEIKEYLVSEKLDGVRARWDGKRLISRGGKVFAVPAWFTEGFPSEPLDGELWIGRGRYEEVSSVVRRKQPHDGWRTVRLMVFDLPEHDGMFEQRAIAIKRLVEKIGSPYIMAIEQKTIKTHADLMQHFQDIIDLGGEGLMLHRKGARYAVGRSRDLLKLKPFTDADATVIGYRPGKGRLAGMVGSLKVRTDQSVILSIGSGLTDKERRHPPPLQSRITFRYQGLTKNGIPRFPVFIRVRNEEPKS